MELEIKKQADKPFLERKELVLKGKAETTPSKARLKEEIAKKMSCPPEMVIVKRIGQQFGKQEIEVNAYVYGSEKALKKFEAKQENTKKAKLSGVPETSEVSEQKKKGEAATAAPATAAAAGGGAK